MKSDASSAEGDPFPDPEFGGAALVDGQASPLAFRRQGDGTTDQPQKADLSWVPIKNFHMVKPWLYRGGQPGAEGIKALSRLGIKTVVSFRWGRNTIKAEEAGVASEGMSFISMPLNYWNMPTPDVIDRFLSILDNDENHPIFIHCFHGSDRTGLLMAIYRMARDSWTVDEAYREMKRYGFHRFRIRNFKWMLWSYARKRQKNQ